MIQSSCGKLDDFLSGALTDPERNEFMAHLEWCSVCGQAVREQKRLNDVLLRAVEALEPVPLGLTGKIETRLRLKQQRRRLQRLASAAVVLFAAATVGSWLAHTKRAPKPVPMVVTPSAERAPIASSEGRVRVTFPEPFHVIALPAKSDNPNVTILWVYPATEGARHGKGDPASRSKPGKESS
jgi:anti-sigma factor RsiW